MKKLLSLVLCLAIVLSVGCVDAIAVQVNEVQDAQTVAENEILKFVFSGDPIVTWNETTEVSSYIELHDFDENINGYIFHVVTDGEASGFIQVGKFNGVYTVMNLGFEGDDYLTNMLHSNGIDESILEDETAYFLGNMNYYIYQDGDLVDLSEEKVCETDVENLMSIYNNEYSSQVSRAVAEQAQSVSAYATSQTITVGNVASSQLRSMNFYSGYQNHCAPTAATNLVLYWSVYKGKTALGTNANSIFSTFYSNMGTTSNGTLTTNVYGPIESYFTSKLSTNLTCGSYNWSSSSSSVHYATITSLIDNGIPMLLGITNWSSGSIYGHAVNIWGYNSGTTKYLYITDNQSSGSYPGFSLINYASYTYSMYVFTGYSG